MGKKGERNSRFMVNGEEITRALESDAIFFQENTNEPQHIFEGFAAEVDIPFPVLALLSILGNGVSNNELKIHGIPMRRKIAGRKRVRKPKPRKQLKTRGVKK